MLPSPTRRYLTSRAAFTLLEVCIAVFIAVMLVMVALPTISSLARDRQSEEVFREFDQLVKDVRRRSLEERQPYTIVWTETGVVGKRDGADDSEENIVGEFLVNKGESLTLELPAAMKKNPEWIWTFWSSGACEPAVVRYSGGSGGWTAVYNPFTAEASVTYE